MSTSFVDADKSFLADLLQQSFKIWHSCHQWAEGEAGVRGDWRQRWQHRWSLEILATLERQTKRDQQFEVSYCPGNWKKNLSSPTWRKWIWSSEWESLSSSASFILSSVISFWIFSSSCSAWLMAVFSWALTSSLTSKRFSSIERISSVKTASLSSAAARAER